MVHALREARRVLKPDGILIDLRPAASHRRVGVLRAGRLDLLGTMRESFADDHAANRAVAEAVRRGWFKAVRRFRFECTRTMDNVGEFRAWLDDFVARGKLPSHEWLVERIAQAIRAGPGKAKVVVTGPVDLRALRRHEALAAPKALYGADGGC